MVASLPTWWGRLISCCGSIPDNFCQVSGTGCRRGCYRPPHGDVEIPLCARRRRRERGRPLDMGQRDPVELGAARGLRHLHRGQPAARCDGEGDDGGAIETRTGTRQAAKVTVHLLRVGRDGAAVAGALRRAALRGLRRRALRRAAGLARARGLRGGTGRRRDLGRPLGARRRGLGRLRRALAPRLRARGVGVGASAARAGPAPRSDQAAPWGFACPARRGRWPRADWARREWSLRPARLSRRREGPAGWERRQAQHRPPPVSASQRRRARFPAVSPPQSPAPAPLVPLWLPGSMSAPDRARPPPPLRSSPPTGRTCRRPHPRNCCRSSPTAPARPPARQAERAPERSGRWHAARPTPPMQRPRRRARAASFQPPFGDDPHLLGPRRAQVGGDPDQIAGGQGAVGHEAQGHRAAIFGQPGR